MITDKKSEPTGWRKGLTRNVVVLGFVSLLNDGASEMIYPLLPVFLTAVLGAGPAALGIIEGVAEADRIFPQTVFRLSFGPRKETEGMDSLGLLHFQHHPAADRAFHVLAARARAPVLGSHRQGAAHVAAGCDHRRFDARGIPRQSIRISPGDGPRRRSGRAHSRHTAADGVPARSQNRISSLVYPGAPCCVYALFWIEGKDG